MCKKILPLLMVILTIPALAQVSPFTGSVGMDFLFQSPATIRTAFTLKIDVGRGGVESRTILSLVGLEAQKLWLWLNFDGIILKSGLTFDPCFSRWTLEIRGGCCPFTFGGMFLLGNLAPACQPPNYTVGLILDLAVGGIPGLFGRSLTGFGVRNLYALLDGDPWTDVTLVPGWWFEEQLLHFSFATDFLYAYTTWLFTWAGLSWAELGGSYTFFLSPKVELGASLRLDPPPPVWVWEAKLWLGLTVDPVTVRSTTAFDVTGFRWQEIALEIRLLPVFFYSRASFDLVGVRELRFGFELGF